MQRFLIVRLGALGDIVHAIPVAAALRRAFPSASVDWLVSRKHQELLTLVPIIDRLIIVNNRSGAGKGESLIGALKTLRREPYDVAFDLQGLMKSAVLARGSGAERVIGFCAAYAREPLASWLYDEAYDPGGEGMFAPSETRHVTKINLGMLELLGVAPGPREFPIDVPPSAVAEAMMEQTGGTYALLNPGAAWPNKRWPPERLAAVARALYERRGLRSVILWGPGEEGLAREVVAGAEGTAILSPEAGIPDLVALARGAAVMVSGDTGPTHIAAAVATPIVGIYGPTRPERNGPWRRKDETVSRAAICQCHHERQCRAERMCLLDIEVDEVLAAVERRLDKAVFRLDTQGPAHD